MSGSATLQTNMDPRAIKRAKTHDFRNEDEANAYIADTKFNGTPKDVWLEIMTSNHRLSVRDIRVMCSANVTFRDLCATGIVWDKIFIKQFGLDKFLQVRAATEPTRAPGLTNERAALLRLLAMRVRKYAGSISSLEYDGYGQAWNGGKVDNWLQVSVYIFRETIIVPERDNIMTKATIIEGDDTSVMVLEEGIRVSGLDQVGFTETRAVHHTGLPGIARWDEDFPTTYSDDETKAEFEAYNERVNLAFTVFYFWIMQRGYKYYGSDFDYEAGDGVNLHVGGSILCDGVRCSQKVASYCGGCLARSYCSLGCATLDWNTRHGDTCTRKME
jgi:hypothetical protein